MRLTNTDELIKRKELNNRNIMNMKLRNIPFSPPDMTEREAEEVKQAILSGWITTGPKTKELERQISEYVHTDKIVESTMKS